MNDPWILACGVEVWETQSGQGGFNNGPFDPGGKDFPVNYVGVGRGGILTVAVPDQLTGLLIDGVHLYDYDTNNGGTEQVDINGVPTVIVASAIDELNSAAVEASGSPQLLGPVSELVIHHTLQNPIVGGTVLFDLNMVPEPSTGLLGLLGAGLLFVRRRR